MNILRLAAILRREAELYDVGLIHCDGYRVKLTRRAGPWFLLLWSDSRKKPIPPATCKAWAQAVGAQGEMDSQLSGCVVSWEWR